MYGVVLKVHFSQVSCISLLLQLWVSNYYKYCQLVLTITILQHTEHLYIPFQLKDALMTVGSMHCLKTSLKPTITDKTKTGENPV